MLKRFFFLTSSLILATSAAYAATPVTPVKATLTGIDCGGDYCELAFVVDGQAQKAVCADETYCEQWADADAIPAALLAKPASLKIERHPLEENGKEVDVVSHIQF